MTNNKTGNWIIVLGVLLLIGGFIAYVYEQRHGWENPFTGELMYLYSTYPYRDLGMLLIVLGVVLIIVGAVLKTLKKPEEEKQPSPPPPPTSTPIFSLQ